MNILKFGSAKYNLKNITPLIIFAVYAIFNLVMVLHHEIWADEAQAWVVVRDLNLNGIISHVRTEGHPLLWYLLIFPFAKLFHNFNAVFSMQFLNWLLVTIGAGYLVFKSPFNICCKTAILLSSGFLYWYPVMARSYCLIPILLFLLANFYFNQASEQKNSPVKHPFIFAVLLILLANTHIIMFGFCLALGVVFALTNKDKKSKLASVIIFLSLTAIVFYLAGSQHENFIVSHSRHVLNLSGFLSVYKRVVFNIFGNSNLFYTAFFTLFLFCWGVAFWLKDKKVFFVYFANIFFQFFVYMFVWGSLPQRAFILLLTVVFGFWAVYNKIESQSGNAKIFLSSLLAVSFLLTLPDGLKMIKDDYTKEFSGGKKAAKFIKNNLPQDAILLSNDPVPTVSISAYLSDNKTKRRFWYLGYKDFYTYTIWNKPLVPSYAPVPIQEFLKQNDTVYVILGSYVFYQNLKPVFASDSEVLTTQENYRIYKITRKK